MYIPVVVVVFVVVVGRRWVRDRGCAVPRHGITNDRFG